MESHIEMNSTEIPMYFYFTYYRSYLSNKRNKISEDRVYVYFLKTRSLHCNGYIYCYYNDVISYVAKIPYVRKKCKFYYVMFSIERDP